MECFYRLHLSNQQISRAGCGRYVIADNFQFTVFIFDRRILFFSSIVSYCMLSAIYVYIFFERYSPVLLLYFFYFFRCIAILISFGEFILSTHVQYESI